MSAPADHQMWAEDQARVVVANDLGEVQYHGTVLGYSPPAPAILSVRMDGPGKGEGRVTSVEVDNVALEPVVDPDAGAAIETLPGMNKAKAAEVLAALQDAGYEVVQRASLPPEPVMP